MIGRYDSNQGETGVFQEKNHLHTTNDKISLNDFIFLKVLSLITALIRIGQALIRLSM